MCVCVGLQIKSYRRCACVGRSKGMCVREGDVGVQAAPERCGGVMAEPSEEARRLSLVSSLADHSPVS